VLNEIFRVLRASAPWRLQRYGPYTTAYGRFNRQRRLAFGIARWMRLRGRMRPVDIGPADGYSLQQAHLPKCNLIERVYNRIQEFRRIATRYDGRAETCVAMIKQQQGFGFALVSPHPAFKPTRVPNTGTAIFIPIIKQIPPKSAGFVSGPRQAIFYVEWTHAYWCNGECHHTRRKHAYAKL
jgi:transposase